MDCLASPLHEDIATCFNAMYNTSLQDSEIKNLLSDVHKPANIDMIVRPTNSGVYTLKDPAMYAIRNVDARLQEVQATIAKSSYENMANMEGHLPTNLYELFSDRCLHTVTFTSMAMQQLDQVRRAAFKPVLPPRPAEIFGDDLPARQRNTKLKRT